MPPAKPEKTFASEASRQTRKWRIWSAKRSGRLSFGSGSLGACSQARVKVVLARHLWTDLFVIAEWNSILPCKRGLSEVTKPNKWTYHRFVMDVLKVARMRVSFIKIDGRDWHLPSTEKLLSSPSSTAGMFHTFVIKLMPLHRAIHHS